jgi:hypothetical protein
LITPETGQNSITSGEDFFSQEDRLAGIGRKFALKWLNLRET